MHLLLKTCCSATASHGKHPAPATPQCARTPGSPAAHCLHTLYKPQPSSSLIALCLLSKTSCYGGKGLVIPTTLTHTPRTRSAGARQRECREPTHLRTHGEAEGQHWRLSEYQVLTTGICSPMKARLSYICAFPLFVPHRLSLRDSSPGCWFTEGEDVFLHPSQARAATDCQA